MIFGWQASVFVGQTRTTWETLQASYSVGSRDGWPQAPGQGHSSHGFSTGPSGQASPPCIFKAKCGLLPEGADSTLFTA